MPRKPDPVKLPENMSFETIIGKALMVKPLNKKAAEKKKRVLKKPKTIDEILKKKG